MNLFVDEYDIESEELWKIVVVCQVKQLLLDVAQLSADGLMEFKRILDRHNHKVIYYQ